MRQTFRPAGSRERERHDVSGDARPAGAAAGLRRGRELDGAVDQWEPPRRDGLHQIWSVARALRAVTLAPLNLGSSELVTINQLVDLVEEIAGLKLKRRYNLSAPKGVNGRNSDNTLIRKLFGWEPSTRLRDGLEQTYRWIYDQMAPASPVRSPRLASTPR